MEYYYGSIKNEKKIKNTKKKISRAAYFKEESGFNHEEYTGKLRTMLLQLNNIGAPLHPAEELSYLLNGIKSGNYDTKTERINTKTYHIGMAVDFEAAYLQLSNFILEVRATNVILYIETDMGVKVKNQDCQISTLIQKETIEAK